MGYAPSDGSISSRQRGQQEEEEEDDILDLAVI